MVIVLCYCEKFISYLIIVADKSLQAIPITDGYQALRAAIHSQRSRFLLLLYDRTTACYLIREYQITDKGTCICIGIE